ncbi:MAG: ABC transporter ATP-binding protein [Cardiobacteriaceae bacterium]|nr:ABC transporter ATP-binding protein [Cardiobacteriaceae bacterium]
MITLSHLHHRYPGATAPALTDINLHIAPGEALGLLGPNGAGKTTLMSLLAGLQSVQQGEVLFEGTPLARLPRAARQKIALVPQDFAFYPQLTVWDNLRFFASLYDLRDDGHLRQLLARTDLTDHRHKRAAQLSGGLKRRLNVAIGLVNRPRLLFLDEITVGIDPASRAFILDSVAALRREGVTILYTSHYLQEIEQLCDRLALLSHGRLVFAGTLADLPHAPELHFRTEPPLNDADLAHFTARRAGEGVIIPADDPAPALTQLSARGYRLTACHFGKPSLERFYLDFLAKEHLHET